MSFQANTDHGAFSITAAGLTCSVARKVIRAAVSAATRADYCRYRPHENNLGHPDWRCRKGGARVITFAVS